jgi:phosphoribosylaminoimidazole carboxylase
VRSYPVVETVHKNNICHLVFVPPREVASVVKGVQKLAKDAVKTFTSAGVFVVEMFLMPDSRCPGACKLCKLTDLMIDSLMINEIAPRPHNSGCYTIEACHSSQYDNHLRTICSLPLGSTDLKVPSSIMLNLIGQSKVGEEIRHVAQAARSVPGASVHLLGTSAGFLGSLGTKTHNFCICRCGCGRGQLLLGQRNWPRIWQCPHILAI